MVLIAVAIAGSLMLSGAAYLLAKWRLFRQTAVDEPETDIRVIINAQRRMLQRLAWAAGNEQRQKDIRASIRPGDTVITTWGGDIVNVIRKRYEENA